MKKLVVIGNGSEKEKLSSMASAWLMDENNIKKPATRPRGCALTIVTTTLILVSFYSV